ncbi:hypothetical protein [Aliivibrio fischeri]|uniref:Uncharacterized protein n=1 Tax=Aliivibrio fischeri TaxID=668 RepID=A0A510UIM2_ALIFS|nr:hypothetical protein [Aliivibrio fischeri]GEK13200.1 hypothetical protein AFI02nite_12360 [Aliivibrio fischeri]
MCDCLSDNLNKIRFRLIESLPKRADLSTLKVTYQNKVLRLDGRKNDVLIGVDIEFYKNKRDGVLEKRKVKNFTSIEMSHCPFCGREYEK